MRKTILSLASMAAAVLFASSVAAFLLALAEPQAAQAAGKPNIIFVLTDDQFPGTDLKSKLLTFPGGRFAPHNEEERAQVAGLAHSWRSFRSRAQAEVAVATVRPEANADYDNGSCDLPRSARSYRRR
jgi:hypothetical protein